MIRFAPRKAGPADVTVSDDSGGDNFSLKVELEVEERFWGAARLGIGTLFGDFREYKIGTPAGSQTTLISESRVPVQFEIVTGVALYPEALDLRGGGRGYSGYCKNYHLAPFVGFGLVGQSATGIAALTSFHIGLEVEFTRELSLAATFVLKRSRGLSNGYAVGSPINAGAAEDSFTTTSFVPGGALVLTATPQFLQFSTGASTSEK
jgi:hypothetical protein